MCTSWLQLISYIQDEIEVLLQILCTLLNFAYDTANLPMFDSCNITPLLLTFARCPHFESALLSRIVLSFLTPLLNYEQLPALKLDKVETAYFASTLQQAMHSSDQEAEGYSILELLKIITCFTNSCYGLPLSFKDCKHRTKSHNQAEVTTETCGMSNKVSRHQCELMKYSKMIEENISLLLELSLIHIWRCRRSTLCRSRWSPDH